MSTLKKMCVLGAIAVTSVVVLQPGNFTYVSGQTQASEVKPLVSKLISYHAPAYQVQDITAANLNWYSNTRPLVLPATLQRWDTEPYDSTASWPDVTDATRQLPMAVQVKFACIRYHESRNHVRSVEIHSHAAGWYQFTPYIWWYATTQLRGLPASAALATGDQQSRVAVWFYKRNSGFYPEWAADDSVCNL